MASRGNRAGAKEVSTEAEEREVSALIERITVALVPKVGRELQSLLDRTKLSKTDVVNRAITLYEFLDAQQRAGYEVQLLNKTTDEVRTIMFF